MQQVEAFAYYAHGFNHVLLVTLPKSHQNILNLLFLVEFQDDITAWTYPFAVASGNEEQRQAQRHVQKSSWHAAGYHPSTHVGILFILGPPY
jgi:hypothetical protein